MPGPTARDDLTKLLARVAALEARVAVLERRPEPATGALRVSEGAHTYFHRPSKRYWELSTRIAIIEDRLRFAGLFSSADKIKG